MDRKPKRLRESEETIIDLDSTEPSSSLDDAEEDSAVGTEGLSPEYTVWDAKQRTLTKTSLPKTKGDYVIDVSIQRWDDIKSATLNTLWQKNRKKLRIVGSKTDRDVISIVNSVARIRDKIHNDPSKVVK